MPRYFFAFDGSQAPSDDEGVELPDLDQALREAASSIGTSLAEFEGCPATLSATISDATGPKARLSVTCSVEMLDGEAD